MEVHDPGFHVSTPFDASASGEASKGAPLQQPHGTVSADNVAHQAGITPPNSERPSLIRANGESGRLGSSERAQRDLPEEKTVKSMVKGALSAIRGGLSRFASTTSKAIKELATNIRDEVKDRKEELKTLAGKIGIAQQQRPVTANDYALDNAERQLKGLRQEREELGKLHQETLYGPVGDLPREYQKENGTAHMNIINAQRDALKKLDGKISELEEKIQPMVDLQKKEIAEFLEKNPTLIQKAGDLPGKIREAASNALSSLKEMSASSKDASIVSSEESKPVSWNARLGKLKESAGEALQGIKNAAAQKLGALKKALFGTAKAASNSTAAQSSSEAGTAKASSVKGTTQSSSLAGSLKKMPEEVQGMFQSVDSSTLSSSGGKKARDDFMADSSYQSTPPVISKSEFVPASMAEHLMRDKKDSAIAVKYVPGDSITNMEGAMHTFLTPITQVSMTADYKYEGGHKGVMHKGEKRQVIMSAAIHPDLEKGGSSEVVMRLIEVKEKGVQGKELPEGFTPLSSRHDPGSKEFKAELPAYEDQLRDHMVFQLTRAHGLPPLSEVKEVMTEIQGIKLLEAIIRDPEITDIASALEGKFMDLNGHVVSLEAFYTMYLHQMRNEFSVLEAALPQGYVYTIDPPAIFAAQIGIDNVVILNRLQLLALKELNANSPLANLKVVGFNNFADTRAIPLYKEVFPDKEICPKSALFQGPEKKYSRTDNYALVDHNNSDAFGQNIETEGPTSKDGVLGVFSDAAHHLQREREDLMEHVV